MKKRLLNKTNVIFFSTTAIVALASMIFYSVTKSFTWFHVGIFLAMFSLTMLSISGGYHRLYSHRSYDGSKVLKFFYLIFGAAAFEQSCRKWASQHRIHHRFVDTELDPYNIKQGPFWAHIGWILYEDEREYETPKDLLSDPLILWQEKYWMLIGIVVCFGLPTFVGLLFGDPLGGLLFGGVVRLVAAHHCTFMINSLAHMIGKANYSEENTARDSWITAIFTFGEGYHNYHHFSPSDYRNGVRRHHWDPPKWFIMALSWVGQTWELKRTNEEDIIKARASMELKRVQSRLSNFPTKLQEHFDNLMKSAEELSVRRKEWTQSKRAQASQMIQNEKESLQLKFNEARRQFIQAKKAWKRQLVSAL